jgi:hypothetical protein
MRIRFRIQFFGECGSGSGSGSSFLVNADPVPDPALKMNADPSGSGFRIQVRGYKTNILEKKN